MSLTIKDPGSALTHFIGMLLAILASVPLLALAASRDGQNAVLAFAFCMQYDPALWCQHYLPYL